MLDVEFLFKEEQRKKSRAHRKRNQETRDKRQETRDKRQYFEITSNYCSYKKIKFIDLKSLDFIRYKALNFGK